MGPDREPPEESLAAAIQNLSLPGKQALARGRPDELAVAFDEAYTAYVDSLDRLPQEGQLLSLQALDSALSSMSGPDNMELWTEAALEHHPRWDEIRDLARVVLARFEWPSAL